MAILQRRYVIDIDTSVLTEWLKANESERNFSIEREMIHSGICFLFVLYPVFDFAFLDDDASEDVRIDLDVLRNWHVRYE
jgi:hypothetical protein